MKRKFPYAFCLLLTALLLPSCSGEKKDVQAYLDEAFRLFQERHEDTAAIAGLLSKGLAEHPDSLPLLQSRASLYCNRGMPQECRADARRMLELKPDHTEARMMLCLLDEFEDVAGRNDHACYQGVADIYAARPPAASPEAETANTLNYVFALLMARNPDAEKEKNAFLEKMGSDPNAELYRSILNDFDRQRIFREVFGQGTWK